MESLVIWDCVLQQVPFLWEDCMLLNWTLRHMPVIYEHHNNGRLYCYDDDDNDYRIKWAGQNS